MNRAYAVLEIKAIDDERRVIEGVATTPTPDRVGDIVEPLGVKFKNPMPLLWQHKSDKPVGLARFEKPTEKGINFRAELPKVEEAGALKDRVDEAWQSVKHKLVRGVSIGFRALEHNFMDDGGIRFIETEVLELSLVTIPANAEATIQAVKSIDTEQRAASGHTLNGDERPTPPAPGKKPTKVVKAQEGTMAKKSIAEQISAFEATRAAKDARMTEIMEAAAEKGETLDEAGKQEYEDTKKELGEIDEHLVRLREQEKRVVASAAPANGKSQEDAAASRAGVVITVREQKLPPGIRLARVVKMLGLAKGSYGDALRMAEHRYPDDKPVQSVLKAAVAAGSTASGNWAEDLTGDTTSVYADFVEYLRPQTIIGKFGTNGIPSLRRVPFRVPLISQTGAGAGYWVGEGKAKPLTSFDFARTTLEPLKVANIAVLTEETLRSSSPSAEMIVRDQLVAALRSRLDTDFIDPDKAASAGVSPASITNGVSATASAGNDSDDVRTDIKAIFASFIAANNAPTSGVWIMSATTALSLSLMLNPLGQPEFPGISMNGGTLFGLPVIVSEFVPDTGESPATGKIVALVNAQDIYLADDGDFAVDMSREASLEMSDGPAHDSVTPTGASLVSMFQTNSVAFRAERTMNWAKRRATAVAVLSAVNWGAAA